jgi:hypothetical protein
MSTTTTAKVLGFAATLIGTAGLLTISFPAAALPRCTQWIYNDAALFLDMEGARVGIPWIKDTGSVCTGNTDARFMAQQFTMQGSAEGGWSPQGSFDVTVHWTQGVPDAFGPNHSTHFMGNLNELGVPSGWTDDGRDWSSQSPFSCTQREADPAANAGADPENKAGQPPPPVTNAISPSFDASSNTTVKVTVKNSSKLPATCNYEAVSQNPLVPSDTTTSFDVPPNGSHTESFNGLKTGTNYTITINCTDSSGTQTEPLGSVSQTVKW